MTMAATIVMVKLTVIVAHLIAQVAREGLLKVCACVVQKA
jgi:hypothetical protein